MEKRPNILFLISDQHHAGVLGCEGHPDVRTPHIDRLAAEGVRFSRAYCQDAICTPSRCSLFSGYYPRTLGCLGNSDRSPFMKDVVPLQESFHRHGYATAAFGKRHLYLGCDRGWDIKASHLVIESPDDNYVHWVTDQGHGETFDRDWAAEFGRGAENTPSYDREIPHALLTVRESQLPDDLTMEAWTARRAGDFLRARAGEEDPFFCVASFYRPHQPYTPLPKYFGRFDRSHWGNGRNAGDGLAEPRSLRQPVEDLPPAFQAQTASKAGPFQFRLAREDEQIYRDYLAAYYALVEEIDDHVGTLLHVLEETGQLENTIVLYTSDHGDFAGHHGMAEKCSVGHNVYEDTVRVPMLFRFPGFASGRTDQSLVELLDLYPTLAEVCGLPLDGLPKPPEGRSLQRLLRGEDEGGWRKFTVTQSWNQSTVITDRYKLGVWTEPGRAPYRDFRSFGDMLFDRSVDPEELHNMSGNPGYAEVEADLRSLLEGWQHDHMLHSEKL